MKKNEKKKIKIIVLFVQYNQSKYDNSFFTLKATLDKFTAYYVEYIVIDNSLNEITTKKTADNVTVINGDNSGREFTGWQKGIEKINQLNLDYDLILFINEAYLAYNDSYLSNHLNSAVRRSLKFDAVTGSFDIDEKQRMLRIYNYQDNKWLRSNIFFIPKIIMQKLNSFIFLSDEEFDKIVPPGFPVKIASYRDCFTAEANLNETFMEKTFTWLTVRWHSRIELNEGTWPLFRIKARAIFNEFLLTATIRSLGFELLWFAASPTIFIRRIFRKILGRNKQFSPKG